MKVKTKNNRSLVAILVVLLLAFVGTTIAYHTSKGDFMNVFRTIFDQWTVTEEFVSPNDWSQCQRIPKTITATNTGNSSVGVRIKYEEYWKRAGSTSTTHDTELPLQVNGQNLAVVKLNTNNDWELRNDGYYYYTRPLEPYSTTSTFMDFVEYNCDANIVVSDNTCETVNGQTVCTQNDYNYDGAQYHLYATVELTDEPETYNVTKPTETTLVTGTTLNLRMKELANPNQSFSGTGTADSNIRSIKMASSLPANFEPTWKNEFQYYYGSPVVYGWFDSSTGTFYFYTEADYIKTHTDMRWAFQEFDSLTDISGLANWHTEASTQMNSLFSGCDSLTSIDSLRYWDVSNVTTLAYAFYGDTNLSNISGLTNWHTGKVTNMECLFYNNSSLTNLDAVANWDTSSVETLGWLLWGSSSLTNLNGLRHWDTSNVTAINSTFNGCTSLTDISGIANWDTSNVTNMGYIMRAVPVTNLTALINWDIRNVQYLDHAFREMPNLKNLNGLKNWDTRSVETLNSTFYANTSLEDISGLANWNTGNVTNISWMFGSSRSDDEHNISTLSPLMRWDVHKVTNASCAFYSMSTKLYNLDGLQNWQVGSFTDTSWMFANNTSALSDISQLANWDMSNVTDLNHMFSGDYSVNGSSLNRWTIRSDADTSWAFTDTIADKPAWYQG
jgi:alternate signal-mediated exported protein